MMWIEYTPYRIRSKCTIARGLISRDRDSHIWDNERAFDYLGVSS